MLGEFGVRSKFKGKEKNKNKHTQQQQHTLLEIPKCVWSNRVNMLNKKKKKTKNN